MNPSINTNKSKTILLSLRHVEILAGYEDSLVLRVSTADRAQRLYLAAQFLWCLDDMDLYDEAMKRRNLEHDLEQILKEKE